MEGSCLTSLRIAPYNYCIREARSFSTAFALKTRKEIRNFIQLFLAQPHPQFHVKTKTITASPDLPTAVSGAQTVRRLNRMKRGYAAHTTSKMQSNLTQLYNQTYIFFYFCTCKATRARWNLKENSWGLQQNMVFDCKAVFAPEGRVKWLSNVKLLSRKALHPNLGPLNIS